MKNLLIVLFILGTGLLVNAQQRTLHSQYMFNDFILNPAIAGTGNYSPASISLRRQWVGINEAPVTQSISWHTYCGKNVGMGGYIFNDVAGPTRRAGLGYSFAYQVKLKENEKLAFGVSGQLFQYLLESDKLITAEPDDAAIFEDNTNQLIPDITYGMYYYTNAYYVGFTAFNLIQTRLDMFDNSTINKNNVLRTYYLTGGYRIDINDSYMLEPSLHMQFMEKSPLQFDITTKLVYAQQFWAGFSYRLKDAVVCLVGMKVNLLDIGYSYDITLSDLKDYSSGSHELYIGYRFLNKFSSNEKSKVPWFKRNRMYSPIF
jgi:type IX secretion system PorP/SprF family membrane protein